MSDESTPREKDFMDMDDEFENPLGGGGSGSKDEPGASLHTRECPAAASELKHVPRARLRRHADVCRLAPITRGG
jgi:hypothetical protein